MSYSDFPETNFMIFNKLYFFHVLKLEKSNPNNRITSKYTITSG